MDRVEVEAVAALLGASVRSTRPVAGGSIADACRIELADRRVAFVKSGAGLPAGLLDVEAEALAWLAEPQALRVPRVLGLSSDPPVLVLEWIEPGPVRQATADHLGRGLATLHRFGATEFGWHRDGYIGLLAQRNDAADAWPAFWLSRRIEPLARRAVDRGTVSPAAVGLVERLGTRIDMLAGPAEPPARLHGDLWPGNVMTDRAGQPWVVDPAAYGGHREVDLAMLSLFGQPGQQFFAAYEEVTPLADGWEDRLRLWQLEPILVHATLFGGAYGSQAVDILRHFT